MSVVNLRKSFDDDVEEMFLRLQNGTTLHAPEKRNAMPGKMKQFVRGLSRHVFFENCGFANHRFAFDHIAAQMVLPELNLKCDAKKCEWDNWHADHRIPWSKGGETTVENGQVSCPECNMAKSDAV